MVMMVVGDTPKRTGVVLVVSGGWGGGSASQEGQGRGKGWPR